MHRWKIYEKYVFFHVNGWRGHKHSISNNWYMFFVVLCCTALFLSSNFVKLYPCWCLDIWHYKYILLFLRDFMWKGSTAVHGEVLKKYMAILILESWELILKTDPSYLGKYVHHYFKIKSLSTIVMKKNTFPLFAATNSFLLPSNVQTYIIASLVESWICVEANFRLVNTCLWHLYKKGWRLQLI